MNEALTKQPTLSQSGDGTPSIYEKAEVIPGVGIQIPESDDDTGASGNPYRESETPPQATPGSATSGLESVRKQSNPSEKQVLR
jgi:hypothetical protein